ncbi:hypothetical protein JCM10213_002336 [Rhodosporidiobolus nylandii]
MSQPPSFDLEAFLSKAERAVDEKLRLSQGAAVPVQREGAGGEDGAAGGKRRAEGASASAGEGSATPASVPSRTPTPAPPPQNSPAEDALLLSLHRYAVPAAQIALRLEKRTSAFVQARLSVLADRAKAEATQQEKRKREGRASAAPPLASASSGSSTPAPGPSSATATNARAQNWTPFDDKVLQIYRKRGHRTGEIAITLGRERSEVRERWKAMKGIWRAQGLIPPSSSPSSTQSSSPAAGPSATLAAAASSSHPRTSSTLQKPEHHLPSPAPSSGTGSRPTSASPAPQAPPAAEQPQPPPPPQPHVHLPLPLPQPLPPPSPATLKSRQAFEGLRSRTGEFLRAWGEAEKREREEGW